MYGINEWLDKVAKAYRKLFRKALSPTKVKKSTTTPKRKPNVRSNKRQNRKANK